MFYTTINLKTIYKRTNCQYKVQTGRIEIGLLNNKEFLNKRTRQMFS